MKKHKKVVAGVVVVVLLALAGVWMVMQKSKAPVLEAPVIDMKNEACPVSGNPVDGEHSCIIEGKSYNLCSEECAKPLSENPEKYTN